MNTRLITIDGRLTQHPGLAVEEADALDLAREEMQVLLRAVEEAVQQAVGDATAEELLEQSRQHGGQ